MSKGLVIAIVVAAVIVIAILFLLARRRSESRLVEKRRTEAVEGHKEAAQERLARADVAEREAQRERAEAELHQARARLHEQGLADDELVAGREGTADPVEDVPEDRQA